MTRDVAALNEIEPLSPAHYALAAPKSCNRFRTIRPNSRPAYLLSAQEGDVFDTTVLMDRTAWIRCFEIERLSHAECSLMSAATRAEARCEPLRVAFPTAIAVGRLKQLLNCKAARCADGRPFWGPERKASRDACSCGSPPGRQTPIWSAPSAFAADENAGCPKCRCRSWRARFERSASWGRQSETRRATT
jgi:hypothetical protein